jgi:hypothetical protein
VVSAQVVITPTMVAVLVLRDMKSAERMTRIVQKATEPVNGL